MQSLSPDVSTKAAPSPSVALVLREARRLQRAAQSDSLSTSLPVLRRLLAAGLARSVSLPFAYRMRADLQRKHFLRLLALEAGFASWDAYRPVLEQAPPSDLEPLLLLSKGWALAHHWFASTSEAQAQVDRMGGRVVRIGSHAVALTPEQADHYRQLAQRHG